MQANIRCCTPRRGQRKEADPPPRLPFNAILAVLGNATEEKEMKGLSLWKKHYSDLKNLSVNIARKKSF